MPTYKNIHPNRQSIPTIKDTNGNYQRLLYNKTIETHRFYDDPDNLLLIDDSPHWNPVLKTTTLILSDSNDLQTVKLDPDTFTVEIINGSDELVYLFYQSPNNEPHLPIPAGSSRNIKHFQGYATQLVFKATNAITENEVFVTQYKE